MAKPKRVIWTVEWSEKKGCYNVKRAGTIYAARVKQADAIKRAAEMCEIELRDKGTLSELRIRTKSTGRWRTPRTYGQDPRRSKG